MLRESDIEPPRIVLIGAGHAHLHVIRHIGRLAEARVTLVDPGSFWYSGMASGVLGGSHDSSEDRIDPKRLARHHGVNHVRGRLARLDHPQRLVYLADGRSLPYDLVSLNLGSIAPTLAPLAEGPRAWAVKPIQQLVALRHCLETAYRRGECPALVVVGGGASGVELACNLRALAEKHAARTSITLVTRGNTLLDGAPQGAQHWIAGHLQRLDIQVRCGMRAVSYHRQGVLIAAQPVARDQENLELIECQHVMHASGLAPPPVLEHLGVRLIAGRGVAVGDTLQSVEDQDIFAAGDCAALVDHPLPRLGVYGVRQAPVLLANLAARLKGRNLHRYTPQVSALTILNLGQGNGLAIRGRLWWAGRLSLLWKRRLDERFMQRYRR
ncbi:MAG: FAD-dependent oxidoreductase [Halomonas sp.]|nr:FAD-dependent oxidoreductase [Halomonas sp.]MCC5882063.1 FAD-dependent oxidoreductase [Halomonas sp.]